MLRASRAGEQHAACRGHVNLRGWTCRPGRRYMRKDGTEAVYWTAARHVDGKWQHVYLGQVAADTDDELRRKLRQLLQHKLELTGSE